MPTAFLKHNAAALAQRVAEMSNRLERRLAGAIAASAGQAAQRARALVPVDSGELRDSISAAPDGRLGMRVTANAHHAVMVEYGTSKMAAHSYMLPAAQAAAAPFFESAMCATKEAMR